MIANVHKAILYLSRWYEGARHDFGMMKIEFPPDFFAHTKLLADLGFLGVDKHFVAVEAIMPKKKPKGGILTEVDKIENRKKSSARITIEHVIGFLKRFRVLSEKLRRMKRETAEMILEICAGLCNLKLKNSKHEFCTRT